MQCIPLQGMVKRIFVVGKLYDLPVYNPVGANGLYLPDTELFAGKFVWSANDRPSLN